MYKRLLLIVFMSMVLIGCGDAKGISVGETPTVDATITSLASIPSALAVSEHISFAISIPFALQVLAFPLLQIAAEA